MEEKEVLKPEYDDPFKLEETIQYLSEENAKLKEQIQKVYDDSRTMYRLLDSYETTLIVIQNTIDLVRNNIRLIKEKGNL